MAESRGASPLIFAHRGANSFAPENTLQACEHALKLGCDGVELDLRMCSSGEVVIFHDRKLYRMTGAWGSIHQKTLSRLKELPLQGKSECRIPTLAEVLDLVKDRAQIILDIKKNGGRNGHFESQIVDDLRRFGLVENIIISSFNAKVIETISELAPEYRKGLIFRKRSPKLVGDTGAVESMHAYHRILSKKYVKSLQESGHLVYAWTVDRLKHMQRTISLGVDGIITNRPEQFFENATCLSSQE